MVLKINDTLYVTYTTEGPHNQHYCKGPTIFHHITKTQPGFDKLDPSYYTECGGGNSGNIQPPYQLMKAENLPENSRLCLKCAEKIGKGDHKNIHIDSVFDIPDYSPHTYQGNPVFSLKEITEDNTYQTPRISRWIEVVCHEVEGKMKPIRVLYERDTKPGGDNDWKWVNEPVTEPLTVMHV